MSRRFIRLSSLLILLLSSELWAIGLGDIQLDSALNEPLRAEIALLSATPDEIGDLTVILASSETFERYGIDRPFFLQDLEFNVVNGGVAGSIVQIRSRSPITEPFLTFLVEASWPSGRLLREYTVLLDPPTYAPPSVQETPAVTAPRQSSTPDSGRIDRPAPQPTPAPSRQSTPAPQPVQPARAATPAPRPSAPVDDTPYDSSDGGMHVVQRSQTLWGIASRMRPDSRLTMNQTMLAIFRANPDAFGGNINLLKAGASLRIPSADDVFRISRGDALSEVARQNDAWGIGDGYTPPDTAKSPSLTLVPPDDDTVDGSYDDTPASDDSYSRDDEISDRIAELEAADVPDQQSLIEIRDNELASLRQELANLRGEVYEPPTDDLTTEEPPVDDPFIDEPDVADDAIIDDVFVDTDEVPAVVDDAVEDDVVVDDTVADPTDIVIQTDRSGDKGIVDKIIEFLTGWGGIVLGALVLVAGALTWFMKRGGDEDESGPWETLDSDDTPAESLSATETMAAPSVEDAFVVVEQDSGLHPVLDDTVETPAVVVDDEAESGSFGSLEDTFSSETAVNLDQTDPIAEADFHMAYGLYDQAADLINGALETDPSDKGLMSKLCEIYFVWGNRDAFVDAASRLKNIVGDGASSEWDKIVIMGQQIAADHAMFAGAAVAGATKEVDLSFGDDDDDAGGLDLDFGGEGDGAADVIDLGTSASQNQEGIDFALGESGTEESGEIDVTAEMSTPTVETPTIDQPFEGFDGGTSELPSLEGTIDDVMPGHEVDATAEINLDELDLDIDGLAATEVASLDDIDATGELSALKDTGINEALTDAADATGKNPEVDPNETGVREALKVESFEDLDATGEMRLASDETGRSPLMDAVTDGESTDFGIDDSLLDATGRTQVLSDDMAVETGVDLSDVLSDDDATVLASLDDDFDFAKTEALPADAFDGDDTAETPTIAATDVDLDLDDLTAALKLSDIGDTVEQPRDDATVEQPRPAISGATAEIPTMELGPGEMSDDLQDARTMTEVGTKLDLARAYVDMGDPEGAKGILEEVLDEGDEAQKQQARQLLESLPG